MTGAEPAAATVHRYLDDIDYPCQKEDVVRHAEQRRAPDEVLTVLRALPLGEYASQDDVTKGLAA